MERWRNLQNLIDESGRFGMRPIASVERHKTFARLTV